MNGPAATESVPTPRLRPGTTSPLCDAGHEARYPVERPRPHRFSTSARHLFIHPIPANLIAPIDGPEQIPLRHARHHGPGVDCVLHPGRHRDRPHRLRTAARPFASTPTR